MSRFGLGLIVGVAIGAAGVWLALERPRLIGSDASAITADAGTPSARRHTKRRRRRKHRAHRGDRSGSVEPAVVVLTAADRTLVWRGPRVALSPRELDVGSDTPGGRSLDQGEIDAGIATGSGAIIECIKRARGDAELAATITVRALVEGDGRVSRVRVRAPAYLVARGVARCVQRATKAMRFARTGAQTIVSVPFDLR